MEKILETWRMMRPAKQRGLLALILLVVALTFGLGLWANRSDYQVLFADMTAPDAAAMAAELEKLKTPYQLADNGNTILVPKELVYKTRLKVMGNDIPLRGAVGFEVFNNADFGMTEFVQKINYQRAVQGELTRTIQSIEDVQSVRVHLALPEQSLFKRNGVSPKASISVQMKPQKTMSKEQVIGIQRLVAAAVPELLFNDVTVVDQHGIALTKNSSVDGTDNSTAALDAKRAAEEYILRKVNYVLDKAFGPGEAVASVDAVINLDQIKITTDDVLPSGKNNDAGEATGVVVNEKLNAREIAGDAGAPPKEGGGSVTSSDTAYQVGRRVEQTVVAAGATKRLTIAVVVKKPMESDQLERLKEIVGSAAGFNATRGDAIVVYSLDHLATGLTPSPPLVDPQVESKEVGQASGMPVQGASAIATTQLALLGLLGLAAALAIYIAGRRGRNTVARAPQLSEPERVRMLGQIEQWVATGSVMTSEVKK